MVTGASSGIGKEFTRQLASQGFNIVLVARRENVLNEFAHLLESNYQVDTQVVALDLSRPDAVKELYSAVATLDIGLIIPAAGVDEMGQFLDKDYSNIERMLMINIQAPTEIAHVFANKMLKRKHSAIILVASLFGYQGIPYFAAYAASKAYILTLGETLHAELSAKGIDVLVLSPGLTDTPFSQNMEPVNLFGFLINRAIKSHCKRVRMSS